MITDFIFQSHRKTRAMEQIETIVKYYICLILKILEYTISGAFNKHLSYNYFNN